MHRSSLFAPQRSSSLLLAVLCLSICFHPAIQFTVTSITPYSAPLEYTEDTVFTVKGTGFTSSSTTVTVELNGRTGTMTACSLDSATQITCTAPPSVWSDAGFTISNDASTASAFAFATVSLTIGVETDVIHSDTFFFYGQPEIIGVANAGSLASGGGLTDFIANPGGHPLLRTDGAKYAIFPRTGSIDYTLENALWTGPIRAADVLDGAGTRLRFEHVAKPVDQDPDYYGLTYALNGYNFFDISALQSSMRVYIYDATTVSISSLSRTQGFCDGSQTLTATGGTYYNADNIRAQYRLDGVDIGDPVTCDRTSNTKLQIPVPSMDAGNYTIGLAFGETPGNDPDMFIYDLADFECIPATPTPSASVTMTMTRTNTATMSATPSTVPMSITAVTPHTASVSLPVNVSLSATSLPADGDYVVRISLGNIAVYDIPVERVSGTEGRFLSPNVSLDTPDGFYGARMSISSNGGISFVEMSQVFYFHPEPILSSSLSLSLSPSSGPESGGTVVSFLSPAARFSDLEDAVVSLSLAPLISAEVNYTDFGSYIRFEVEMPPAASLSLSAGETSAFHFSLDGGANYVDLGGFTYYADSVVIQQPDNACETFAGGSVHMLWADSGETFPDTGEIVIRIRDQGNERQLVRVEGTRVNETVIQFTAPALQLASPTASPTVSSTVSPSVSVTASVSGSMTSSPSASMTMSASLSASATMSGSPSESMAPSSSMTSSASITASVTASRTRSLSATPTPSTTPTNDIGGTNSSSETMTTDTFEPPTVDCYIFRGLNYCTDPNFEDLCCAPGADPPPADLDNECFEYPPLSEDPLCGWCIVEPTCSSSTPEGEGGSSSSSSSNSTSAGSVSSLSGFRRRLRSIEDDGDPGGGDPIGGLVGARRMVIGGVGGRRLAAVSPSPTVIPAFDTSDSSAQIAVFVDILFNGVDVGTNAVEFIYHGADIQPCVPSNSPSPSTSVTMTSTMTSSASSTATVTSSASLTSSLTTTMTSTASESPSMTASETASMTSTVTSSASASSTMTSTASASSTMSSTSSMTASLTASETASRTVTMSLTSTETASETMTMTATETMTMSTTATSSSTATETSSASASHTESSTMTASPTASRSAGSTPSRSSSVSMTLSPTASVTASNTASLTASLSPSSSASSTMTSSASESPSSSSSFTATSSASASTTSSATATHSSSKSAGASITATASTTATHSATATRTATMSASMSASSTHSSSASASESASTTASNTASESPTHSATHSSTASGSMSATMTSSATATSTISSTATESATMSASATKSASETASSTESASVTSTMTRSATETISSTSSATATITSTRTSTVSSTSSMSPSATASMSASASATGTMTSSHSATETSSMTSSSTASETATNSASATHSATHTQTGTRTSSRSPTSTMTSSSSLTATMTSSSSLTATMTSSPSSSVSISLSATHSGTGTHSGSHSRTASSTHSISPTTTSSHTSTATPSISRSVTPSITPSTSPKWIRAQLILPKSVAVCARVVLDGSLSLGGGRQSLRYSWRLVSSTAGTDPTVSALSERLTAASGTTTATLTIPGSAGLFLPSESYTIQLTVVNHLGDSDTTTRTMTVSPLTIVSSVIRYPEPPALLDVGRDVVLEGVAEVPDTSCLSLTLRQVYFAWTRIDGPPFDLDIRTKFTRELYIPARTLEAGTTYRLQFAAHMEGAETDPDTVTISTAPWSPVPRIPDPPSVVGHWYTRHRASLPFDVDASEYYVLDGGTPGASSGFGLRCLISTESRAAIEAGGEAVERYVVDEVCTARLQITDAREGTFTAPAFLLTTERLYVFELTAYNRGQPLHQTNISVTPLTDSDPDSDGDSSGTSVRVVGLSRRSHAVHQPLVLRGVVERAPADAIIEWQVTPFLNPDRFQTDRSSPTLQIKPHSLSPQTEYTFRLRAILPSTGTVISDSVVVVAKRTPEGGLISISPASGSALSTPFSLTCTTFENPSRGDLPLRYLFFYQLIQQTDADSAGAAIDAVAGDADDRRVPLSDRMFTNHIETTLPAGQLLVGCATYSADETVSEALQLFFVDSPAVFHGGSGGASAATSSGVSVELMAAASERISFLEGVLSDAVVTSQLLGTDRLTAHYLSSMSALVTSQLADPTLATTLATPFNAAANASDTPRVRYLALLHTALDRLTVIGDRMPRTVDSIEDQLMRLYALSRSSATGSGEEDALCAFDQHLISGISDRLSGMLDVLLEHHGSTAISDKVMASTLDVVDSLWHCVGDATTSTSASNAGSSSSSSSGIGFTAAYRGQIASRLMDLVYKGSGAIAYSHTCGAEMRTLDLSWMRVVSGTSAVAADTPYTLSLTSGGHSAVEIPANVVGGNRRSWDSTDRSHCLSLSLVHISDNVFQSLSPRTNLSSALLDVRLYNDDGVHTPLSGLSLWDSLGIRIPFSPGREVASGREREIERSCVWWSESANEWKGDGCYAVIDASTESSTLCRCSHTTAFAVSVSPAPVPPKPTNFGAIFGVLAGILAVLAGVWGLYAVRRERKRKRERYLEDLEKGGKRNVLHFPQYVDDELAERERDGDSTASLSDTESDKSPRQSPIGFSISLPHNPLARLPPVTSVFHGDSVVPDFPSYVDERERERGRNGEREIRADPRVFESPEVVPHYSAETVVNPLTGLPRGDMMGALVEMEREREKERERERRASKTSWMGWRKRGPERGGQKAEKQQPPPPSFPPESNPERVDGGDRQTEREREREREIDGETAASTAPNPNNPLSQFGSEGAI